MKKDNKESIDIYTIYNNLVNFTIDYIKEDSPNISNISVSIKDGVLINLLNNVGIGYGNYTIDELYDFQSDFYSFNTEAFLKYVVKFIASYIFDIDIVKSVLEDYDYGFHSRCIEFDPNDGVKVLVDFLNYIAKRCSYNHTFTTYELYVINEYQKYKREMKQLKEFLIKTGEYSKKLANDENINDIFDELINKLNLIYDAENNSLHNKVVPEAKSLVFISGVDEEIDALAYAYAKDDKVKNEIPENELIRKRLIEMR